MRRRLHARIGSTGSLVSFTVLVMVLAACGLTGWCHDLGPGAYPREHGRGPGLTSPPVTLVRRLKLWTRPSETMMFACIGLVIGLFTGDWAAALPGTFTLTRA